MLKKFMRKKGSIKDVGEALSLDEERDGLSGDSPSSSRFLSGLSQGYEAGSEGGEFGHNVLRFQQEAKSLKAIHAQTEKLLKSNASQSDEMKSLASTLLAASDNLQLLSKKPGAGDFPEYVKTTTTNKKKTNKKERHCIFHSLTHSLSLSFSFSFSFFFFLISFFFLFFFLFSLFLL